MMWGIKLRFSFSPVPVTLCIHSSKNIYYGTNPNKIDGYFYDDSYVYFWGFKFKRQNFKFQKIKCLWVKDYVHLFIIEGLHIFVGFLFCLDFITHSGIKFLFPDIPLGVIFCFQIL